MRRNQILLVFGTSAFFLGVLVFHQQGISSKYTADDEQQAKNKYDIHPHQPSLGTYKVRKDIIDHGMSDIDLQFAFHRQPI